MQRPAQAQASEVQGPHPPSDRSESSDGLATSAIHQRVDAYTSTTQQVGPCAAHTHDAQHTVQNQAEPRPPRLTTPEIRGAHRATSDLSLRMQKKAG